MEGGGGGGWGVSTVGGGGGVGFHGSVTAAPKKHMVI